MPISLPLHTERLTLRPLQKADADAFFAYRSDADTNRYQGRIPATRAEAAAFIERCPSELGRVGTWFQLAIVADGALIGDVGLHFVSATEVELGFTLARARHGRGYAREAVQGVLVALSAAGFTRATGSVDPRNVRSIRLLEALGFALDARVDRAYELRGEWVDDARYARAL